MFHRVVVIASTVVLLSSSLFAGTVGAGPQWCDEDPEFVVNGATVDVSTFFDGAYTSTVKPPVNFVMHVPSNATAAVIAVPGVVPVTASVVRDLAAYNGIGSLPVTVVVTVKASKTFDTSTYVTGTYGALTSTIAGRSNTTITVKFSLLAP